MGVIERVATRVFTRLRGETRRPDPRIAAATEAWLNAQGACPPPKGPLPDAELVREALTYWLAQANTPVSGRAQALAQGLFAIGQINRKEDLFKQGVYATMARWEDMEEAYHTALITGAEAALAPLGQGGLAAPTETSPFGQTLHRRRMC